MNILLWIIFGGLAGWIASLIVGTDENQGVFLNVIVGIIGAFLGGMVMNLFGENGVTTFSIRSLFIAILGSVILLAFVRVMRNASHRT